MLPRRPHSPCGVLHAPPAAPPPCRCSQGALLCLAAATVGLGEPSELYLRQIVPPVLASFTDQDSRVRYYACEALYNIAKVARESFVIFFNEVRARKRRGARRSWSGGPTRRLPALPACLRAGV
jgi:hypothetical protein